MDKFFGGLDVYSTWGLDQAPKKLEVYYIWGLDQAPWLLGGLEVYSI